MRAELRDDRTLVIIPESTAELMALVRFEACSVQIEKPKPFQQNIEVLKLEILKFHGAT